MPTRRAAREAAPAAGIRRSAQRKLVATYSHHAFITNSTRGRVEADQRHRDHVLAEQVIAELKGNAPAHLPSGKHAANAVWVACAVIAFNLARGAAVAANMPTARAGPRIGGVVVPQRKVLEWEARRLRVVAEPIRHNVPGAVVRELDALVRRPAVGTAAVARDRQLLADVKRHLGEDDMRRLVAGDLALSDAAGALAAVPRRWSVSATEITSSRGTAQGFASWFDARRTRNDVRAMLVACPDHYVIATGDRGRQEVIEVTGGAVLASRFLVDYADIAEVPIAADPDFVVQVAGCARNAKGAMIGGVRHQFRNLPGGGFTAKLGVAFPALLPPWCAPEHRWHLACEFGNWITAYAATTTRLSAPA